MVVYACHNDTVICQVDKVRMERDENGAFFSGFPPDFHPVIF